MTEGKVSDLARVERDRITRRRARVLAHPDIAARLKEWPLHLTTPETWSGYIPPAHISGAWGDKPNPSPVRKQLIDILNAVIEREQTQEEAAS